ncbi:ATP-binding protein [Rhodoblastus sp.]|uniref:sensor histidine kinase n=1 Tax=Rhodoblastus sp. TaxID=1962975 RepID=UPI003F957FFC
MRNGLAAVLLLLALMAAVQAGLTMYWIDTAAFIIKRTEASRTQLNLYEQLSADVSQFMLGALEHLVLTDDAHENSAGQIYQHLDQLMASTAQEADFVTLHGDKVDNAPETARLQRIRSVVLELVNAGDRARSDSPEEIARKVNWTSYLYHGPLDQLLTEAIDRERKEVADVMQEMESLRARLKWIGASCLALPLLMAALLAWIIGQSVLNPVYKLVNGVKALGQGQLSYRIKVRGHDEFGLLAQYINRMAGKLGARNRKLIEQNETLEAIVSHRTQSLREINDELRAVDASRKRFFADVSHEFRTPLTIIAGEAQVSLASKETGPHSYREALSAILANAGYLKRRIDDLLTIARADDGRPSFAYADIDLTAVVGEVVSQCDGMAKANGVALKYEETGEAARIEGDFSWIKQCLLTLVDNAIKFSRPGQVVSLIVTQSGGDTTLSVADEGEGVSPEELPNLFERFYQTQSGQRMGGTGLGLSVARWIVEEHRGKIHAASVPGKGTTISMRFPSAPGVSQADFSDSG